MTTDDNDPFPFNEPKPEPDTVESLLADIRGQVATIRERTNGLVADFNYTTENLAGDRLLAKLIATHTLLGDVLMGLHTARDAIRILPKYVGTIERAEPKP
jgi:hypothetical protein